MSRLNEGPLTPSRREFLSAGIALSAASAGLFHIPAAWSQAAGGISPFRYRAPQAALDDPRSRLARTRWPERETVNDWSQGVPLAKLRALVDYWRGGYDWRRCEAALA